MKIKTTSLTKHFLFISILSAASAPTLATGQQFDNLGSNARGDSSAGSTGALIGKVVTGGVGVYEGHQCVHHNYYACVLAAQCLMQLSQSLGASNGAMDVANAYTPDFNSNNNGAGPALDSNGQPIDPAFSQANAGNPNNANHANDLNSLNSLNNPNDLTDPNHATNSANDASQMKKINTLLSSAGVSVDQTAGTLKLPDGKTMSLKADAAAMKAAGYNAAAIDQTLADERKLEANLMAKASSSNGVPALSFASGGGGGGHSGSNAGGANANGNFNALMGGMRNPSSAKKQSVAGLSRKLGNENIGVKGDNIFEMVNRRYREQDKQNAFLKDQ